MYSPKVLDHFAHPRHAGEMPDARVMVEVANPACGDTLKVWIAVSQEGFLSASFKVAGCVPSVACGSWLVEWVGGKTAAEAARLSPKDIEEGLDGLPPASHHASALAWEALREALSKLPKTANPGTS